MSINESYSAFYTDHDTFCFQVGVSQRTYVNPTKIFTSTFKSINAMVEKHKKDGMITRDIVLRHHYWVLKAYFENDASEKYVAMLDESEWKFWFIHVITELRKLQTSPRWKKDGKIDFNDEMILLICSLIFQRSFDWVLFEKSLRAPKEFFHALVNCIDTLTPRLPQSSFVKVFTDICGFLLLAEFDEFSSWKMMEKSGLLVHFFDVQLCH